MFPRLLMQSFLLQKRRKLLAALAITLGVSVATAMIGMAVDVGDKMNRELRTLGANILVTPQDDTLSLRTDGAELRPPSDGAYLRESDLPKLKTMFWEHNILGFAPMLPLPAQAASIGQNRSAVPVVGTYFAKQIVAGRSISTEGVVQTFPWWHVDGAWPQDDRPEALAGTRVAQQLGIHRGDEIVLAGHAVHITGIVTADPATEASVVVPLWLAQAIAGTPGAVRRVYISALTKPEDELARRDPRTMNAETLERFNCSPYANSIALSIENAIPGAHAEQIRQVAQNEGRVLSRISGLMLLLGVAALLAAGLAVAAAMATSVMERKEEIGLMKALGAGGSAIVALLLSEAGILAMAGGLAGFAAGAVMAHTIGRAVFGSQIAVGPITLPIVLGLALAISLGGSAASIRRALQLDPAAVLRGEA